MNQAADELSIGRRRALALLGAGAAGLLTAATPTASRAATPSAGIPDQRAQFDAFVRLRGSLDERPVYMWLIGRRYLVMNDGRSFPLCGTSNCSITRARRQADDAFELTVMEYNYNTDFTTGEWRDALPMPITGRQVPSPQARADPVHHVWRPRHAFEGRLRESTEFPPSTLDLFGGDALLTIDRKVHAPELMDGEIAFTQDWYLRVSPVDASKKGAWVREVSTVRGDARAAANPRENCVPARTSYSIVYGIPAWTQLEGVPGHVLTTAVGGKATRAADLPPSVRRLMSQRDPGSLGDPETLLRG
jgi:hypothetical protein